MALGSLYGRDNGIIIMRYIYIYEIYTGCAKMQSYFFYMCGGDDNEACKQTHLYSNEFQEDNFKDDNFNMTCGEISLDWW